MPASTRDDALAQIVNYAEAAQHDFHGDFEWDSDKHGNCVRGYIFEDSNGYLYRVYGPTDHQYLFISYQFNAISYITNWMSEEQVQRYLDTPVAYRKDKKEDNSIIAARAYLDSIKSEKMDEIRENVLENIRSPETDYELQVTENGSIHRFLVHRKVFPYHQGFTPESFVEAVRAVVVNGVNGALDYFDPIDLSEFDAEAEPEQEEVESATSTDSSDDTQANRMYR